MIFKDSDIENWKINLINTGINTMTGGRLKRLQRYLKDDTFMLTYGDGLSDIDINKLVNFHKSHGKMITITAVRPPARFGELEITASNKVISFVEKPQLDQGWINGGFFLIEPEFLELIENDATFLEKDPLEKAALAGELMAYKHEGFWQYIIPMDLSLHRVFLVNLYLFWYPCIVKILITSGTSFLGGRIAEYFQKNNFEITIGYRNEFKKGFYSNKFNHVKLIGIQ